MSVTIAVLIVLVLMSAATNLFLTLGFKEVTKMYNRKIEDQQKANEVLLQQCTNLRKVLSASAEKGKEK